MRATLRLAYRERECATIGHKHPNYRTEVSGDWAGVSACSPSPLATVGTPVLRSANLAYQPGRAMLIAVILYGFRIRFVRPVK